jgi:hypothetical protein
MSLLCKYTFQLCFRIRHQEGPRLEMKPNATDQDLVYADVNLFGET